MFDAVVPLQGAGREWRRGVRQVPLAIRLGQPETFAGIFRVHFDRLRVMLEERGAQAEGYAARAEAITEIIGTHSYSGVAGAAAGGGGEKLPAMPTAGSGGGAGAGAGCVRRW